VIPSLLAGLLVAGAAASVPVQKDGTWIEVKSPAFVVFTDAGAGAARRAIARFEKIRAALATAMPTARLSGERELRIVAARNESSLRSLVPQWWESRNGIHPATVHVYRGDHVFLLLRADIAEDDDESYHVAYWGYAAYLIELNLPRLPLWAARGFADFYARTTVQKSRVIIGRAAVSHIHTLRQRGLIPASALFAVDRHSPDYLDEQRLERFDAESWALVHYLMLGDKAAHRRQLAAFLTMLGKDVDAGKAAREAFGDPATLDQALSSYILDKAFYSEAVPGSVDSQVETTPERPLTSAEALTMRAAVHMTSSRFADAHACLDEALKLDPKLAWAHEIQASLAWAEDDPVLARKAVAEALRLEPDRPLSLRLQKRLAGPPTVKGAARLCDAGELEACASLGSWLVDGNGLPADPARGLALMEKACDGGRAEACGQLAWRYRQGTGVAADAGRSTAFLEKGCGAGDGKACLAAAADHSGGGDEGDPAAAARLFESACKRGEKSGCLSLAWALQQGEGVTRDLPRAASLYENACNAGDAGSCTRLALLYVMDDGLPKDQARALALFKKACEQGEQVACSNAEALEAASSRSARRKRP
jgi:TPR repeat protein